MPTNSRLLDLINALNLNPRSFAVECGYNQATTFYSIIKRNAKPSASTLNKICKRFPQVNREWLLTGQGTMFNTPTASLDDLTVTAKQVIDTVLPMIPPPELAENVNQTMIKVERFLSQFEQTQKEIVDIHEKITSIEFLEALKLIKEKKKEKNGNGKTNGTY